MPAYSHRHGLKGYTKDPGSGKPYRPFQGQGRFRDRQYTSFGGNGRSLAFKGMGRVKRFVVYAVALYGCAGEALAIGTHCQFGIWGLLVGGDDHSFMSAVLEGINSKRKGIYMTVCGFRFSACFS